MSFACGCKCSFVLCVRLTFFVNVFIGAKGGQPDFARNKDNVGGAAGFHQDAVRQTTPSGEREPPAQVQDARSGDGMFVFSGCNLGQKLQ